MENVELTFTEESLREIARAALKKKTGARALRSILEDIMLDIMYSLPSQEDVVECVIDDDTVTHKKEPRLIHARKAKDKSA